MTKTKGKRGVVISLTHAEAVVLTMISASGGSEMKIAGTELKAVRDKIVRVNPDIEATQFALWKAAGEPNYTEKQEQEPAVGGTLMYAP